jgi:hypothetical protein
MKTKPIQVEFRTIAKFLVKGIPIDGQEFGEQVEQTIGTIKKLRPEQRTALKAAYVFANKVPRLERADLFQELVVALLERATKDERLAYAIARFDWIDWWRKFTVKQHFFAGSLQDTVEDAEGNEVMLAELIVGECEFERKLDGELDGQALWAKLPRPIQVIVQKRLYGKALNGAERVRLHRFATANPMLLAS